MFKFKKSWLLFVIFLFALGSLLVAKILASPKMVDSWKEQIASDGSKWEIQLGSGKIRPLGDFNKDGERLFGSGYSPVTGFQTQTTNRVSAIATSIPVASVTDKAGNAINPALISSSSTVRMYFNFEPGTSREEPFYCTGISGLNLTPCVRGIAFQGSDLTSSSTIAQAHNAGSSIIMTNLGSFYGNEFVATSGNQTKYGVLTFDSFPVTSSTTALCTSNDQFCNKFYIDNVGAGGFTAANVSTTLGLLATGSVPEKVGINASSTASNTGGFLKFNATGQIYWDLPSFLSRTNVFTNVQGTSTSLSLNFTPTLSTDAVNKGFLDSSISNSYSTGTAGVTITPGQALYVSTTGTLFLTNATASTSSYPFVGVAITGATIGNEIQFTKPGGMVSNQAGLTSGAWYYLSNTPGVIQTAKGTLPVRMGLALSANRLLIVNPSFSARASGTTASTVFGGETTSIVTNFIPTRVDLVCGGGNGASMGSFMVNSNGTKVQNGVGEDTGTATFPWKVSNTQTCTWAEAANLFTITVATTTNGFSLTTSNIGGGVPRTVSWVATVDDVLLP